MAMCRYHWLLSFEAFKSTQTHILVHSFIIEIAHCPSPHIIEGALSKGFNQRNVLIFEKHLRNIYGCQQLNVWYPTQNIKEEHGK